MLKGRDGWEMDSIVKGRLTLASPQTHPQAASKGCPSVELQSPGGQKGEEKSRFCGHLQPDRGRLIKMDAKT